MRTTIFLTAILTLFGCGGGDGSGGAGGSGGSGGTGGSGNVVARYQAPAQTPVDVGAIPFPSDLFLDGSGKISIQNFPSTLNTQFDPAVRDAWAAMDGWGISTGVFFFLSGGDVAASSVAGTIHVYDLATGNEVPVEVGYNDKRHSIGAVPAGEMLAESHNYGAVLVHPNVQPDADFAAIRGATSAPSDARLAKAWTSIQPVLAAASAKGIAANQVAAATAWKTQSTVTPLEKTRVYLDGHVAGISSIIATITATTTPNLNTYLGVPTTTEEGMDTPGMNTPHAVHHANIASVIHANVPLKSFTGTSNSDIGVFQFDASGTPMVKSTYDVAFTIALPVTQGSCTTYANMPLVIFMPGVKHARSDMFAIADGFAAHCVAVASIDAPYHGSRTPAGHDTVNNMTGAAGMDWIGDMAGVNGPIYFFNIGGGSASVKAWDPRALRDNFRQSAADVMQLIRTLTGGDISQLATASGHSELSFRSDVTLIGHSLGGFTTAIIAAVDPHVKVAVLDSCGGGVYIPTLTDGPWFGDGPQGFVSFFSSGFGIMGEFSDGTRESRFHPSLAFYQAVADAGDPFGLARYVVTDTSHRGNTTVHVWLNSLQLDNTVPNQASEPLGAALGLTRVMLSTSNPMLQFATMNGTSAPYAASSGATAAFVRMATTPNNAMFGVGPPHAMIYWTHDTYQNMPPYPPFVSVPLFPVDAPTAKYHRALEQFVMDFYGGMQPTVRDPYIQ
jgi:pimeloyl-ACP methyl ester carboxylesterase